MVYRKETRNGTAPVKILSDSGTTRTYDKGTEELHIAQPSLSKTIARLEKDLGVPLFDRQGRQITLNSFGKVFWKRVERIFHELSEGEREIKDLAELQQSSITLAVSIPRILPELLGSFY